MKEPNKKHTLALDQAVEWYAVLKSGNASLADHIAWETWHDSDITHKQAWLEVTSIETMFKEVQRIGRAQPAKVALLNKTAVSRRQALKLLGFAGTATVGGLLVGQASSWRDVFTDLVASHQSLTSKVGEMRLIPLQEGSRLWLNTNSQATVEYSSVLRRISLSVGELMIVTAKDQAMLSRPLVVDTQHGRLTALGTKFTVWLHPEYTTIAVFEGAVHLQTAKSGTEYTVEAGKQLDFNSINTKGVQIADQARALWTRGILLAENLRLDEFVQALNRYRQTPVSVTAAAAPLLILGAFPLRRQDQILKAIVASLPVTLRISGDGAVVLDKK